MNIISCGCCDNVLIFGKRFATRCNDYIEPLSLWKRLVQVMLRVHRENGSGEHRIAAWKVKVLSKIIKPASHDATWIWIDTK